MADLVGGTVVWSLDIDDTKLKAGLAAAKSSVDSVSKTINDSAESIKTRFSGIAQSFQKAEEGSRMFAVGLGAVTAAGAGVLGFAIKGAADMEMLRGSLDTLTGSTEKGAAMFKELNQFAASTPFETGDLAKASQTMLGFGVTSEKIIPNLRMLGDISQGNRDKLAGLTLAFSQVQSTGRLMGQDLLQMINSGFNPLTIIAQKTGKSMVELKDDMAAGAISADMVRDAMVTATSKGGLFFGGMDKGAKSLSGIWSTLSDTAGMTIRNIVGLSDTGEVVAGGMVDQVKNAVSGLISFFNENQEAIVVFFQTLFGGIADNGPIIIGLIIGGLTPAFIGLAASIAATMIPLLPFIAAGIAIGAVVQLVVNALGGWTVVQKSLNDALTQLGQIYNTFLAPAFNNLFNVIKTQLVPALSGLIQVLSPVLMPILKLVGGVILTVVVAALYTLTQVLSLVISFVSGFIQTFVNAVNFFRSIPNAIGSALGGLRNAIVAPFEDAWRGVQSVVNRIRDALSYINPFARHSPSLVDNVTKGVDVIRSQYESLKSMAVPQLAYAGSDVIYGNSGLNTDSKSISAEKPSSGITVNIGEANIRDEQDIDAIGREVGFRASLEK